MTNATKAFWFSICTLVLSLAGGLLASLADATWGAWSAGVAFVLAGLGAWYFRPREAPDPAPAPAQPAGPVPGVAYGIYMDNVDNGQVVGNRVDVDGIGISVTNSEDPTLEGNTIGKSAPTE